MKKPDKTVIFILLLLLAGIGVALYPDISAEINKRNQTRAIQQYADAVTDLNAATQEEEWALAQAYNDALKAQSHMGFDQMQTPPDYYNVLNFSGSGVMGYIEIPVIQCYLPIYHGTGEDSLRYGVGHIPETPLPIGGEDCHPVLTGHRGLPGAELFTHLDMVTIGDLFYLSILGETLAYEVDQISIVEPMDTSPLMAEDGKDYVSLVTCTPYSVNSHRLLIRGLRTEYIPDATVAIREITTEEANWQIIIICIFIILWLLILARLRWTKNKKKKHKTKNRFVIALLLCAGAGAGLLLYPLVSDFIYTQKTGKTIHAFEERRLKNLDFTQPETTDPLLAAIKDYNQWLFETGQQEGLKNTTAFEEENTALKQLGYQDDLLGYITIEKMDIQLPVYAGASLENMSRGAAHMTHTSIPVGGINTNACIIGHRGMSSAAMFRNIDWLVIGDTVYFSNLWEDLTYTVVDTAVILPHESDKLVIQPDSDMLTLISCYPKGSNTHRYIVYCKRQPNNHTG